MYFVSSISSAVTIVGSQEPLWVAVLQPARAISTSCVHVSKTVRFSRTERFTVTNTRILWVTRYENNFPTGWCILLYCLLIISFMFLLYIESVSQRCDSSVSFQKVIGKGFEVCRRVYVDFEGINLRRKFLTGLEPESINMTIGNDLNIVCGYFQWYCHRDQLI